MLTSYLLCIYIDYIKGEKKKLYPMTGVAFYVRVDF